MKHRLPEYQAWADLKYRCKNPRHKHFKDYGGRGITYHPSWEIFDQFYIDMGNRPSTKYSLDRIDNSLGYSKENCRWVTAVAQLLNRRSYTTKKGSLPGVRKLKKGKSFQAAITINKIVIHLGTFKTEQEAHDKFIQERAKRQGTEGGYVSEEATKGVTTNTELLVDG